MSVGVVLHLSCWFDRALMMTQMVTIVAGPQRLALVTVTKTRNPRANLRLAKSLKYFCRKLCVTFFCCCCCLPSVCWMKQRVLIDLPGKATFHLNVSILHKYLHLCSMVRRFSTKCHVQNSVRVLHHPPKGRPGMSDVSPCLESQGCHLIPLCYLLSCSSA